MKTNVISFLFLIMVVLSSMSCSNKGPNDKAKKMQLIVRVMDNETDEPIRNGIVEVREIEKPLFSRWRYHTILESRTDSLGLVPINISKGRGYSIDVRYSDGSGAVSYEFESDEVNLNEVLEIRALSESERKEALERARNNSESQ